jgi:hypothetical protein
MNVFIRAMVRIFSFGERWNVPSNSAVASWNETFHLSPHENILTIALINIHYLYNILAFISAYKKYPKHSEKTWLNGYLKRVSIPWNNGP